MQTIETRNKEGMHRAKNFIEELMEFAVSFQKVTPNNHNVRILLTLIDKIRNGRISMKDLIVTVNNQVKRVSGTIYTNISSRQQDTTFWSSVLDIIILNLPIQK